jgi:hypothetical protein
MGLIPSGKYFAPIGATEKPPLPLSAIKSHFPE